MGRKKREEVIEELEIESIGFEGISIARVDNHVRFIKGGVPGDIVNAVQFKKKKNRIESKIKEIIKPSPQRIDPKCKYFGDCGGCSWQNMPYIEQLKWKTTHVTDAFVRQEKLHIGKLEDILPSPSEFNYRNKMEFSFGASRWMTVNEIRDQEEIEQKYFALGLHAKGRFDKVIDIHECHIHDSEANFILNTVRDISLELDLKPYNLRTHEGFVRNLMIRKSYYQNEFLVVLITNKVKDDFESAAIEKISLALKERFKGSFIHAVNSKINPTNIDNSELLWGNGYLIERVLNVDFKISAFSFFQTNSTQLDNFIGEILKKAEIGKDDIVWDLYCGTGSISLPAAKISKKVYGIELFEQSVIDARNNAKLNNIENSEFFTADLHSKDTPDLMNDLEKPNIIILDPPRGGIHSNLLDHLLKLNVPKIIYVSCNPMTQARDYKKLNEKYEIISLKPVDMFPQTYHIESIAVLSLK